MIIRFTKAKHQGKHDTLTCVRSDDSMTWWPLSSHFVEHDLLHYIVETTLGLTEAFFGLIAAGRDIESFGTRDGRKDTYTKDEGDAELIVGLMQVEISDRTTYGGTPFDNTTLGGVLEGRTNLDSSDFMMMLASTCAHRGWPMPQSTSEAQIDSIRQRMRELSEQWRKLPQGGSIELSFPTADATHSDTMHANAIQRVEAV